jgi:succinoglycan biosynthesis transport protein ExoP
VEPSKQTELTLRNLLDISRTRRRVVYGTVLVLGLLGATYCAVSTRRYEATGTIQIDKDSSDGLGLDSLVSESGGQSDALAANINILTQASILQSDTLALRTVENLHMEGTEDFRPHLFPVGWLFDLFSSRKVSDAPGASLEDAPERRRRALKVFSKNLTIEPVSGTRLINISYLNPDPKLAAAVVNALTQQLVDYNFQTRYNAVNQASAWLTGQLSDLRKRSEELQAKVVDLERQSGVYSLGTVDAQGREQAYSGVLDQLQQDTTALTMAQQNRILKGAVAHAAATGDAEMLSGLSGNTMLGGVSMNNSLAFLQTLRQQEATEQAALREAEAKYGQSYPKLDEMRANLAAVDHSIHEEIERVRERAQSDYAVAAQTEATIRTQFDHAKGQADKLNDKAIEYAIVRQEAEQSRDLYEDLTKRVKEAGVLEGLKTSNISVVDPGRVSSKPKKPNVPLYMLVSLGAGCFLGCLGALLVDTLDNKISTIAQVEDLTGHTVLGAMPFVSGIARHSTGTNYARRLLPAAADGQMQPIAFTEPSSPFAESMRSIRTGILSAGGGDHCRTVLVTSSIAGEGKTILSANLAVVLALSNRRVLLVDTDMRGGQLRRRLTLPPQTGLSELLAGQRQEPQLSTITGLPDLDILHSGAVPPNPSELLDSKMKEWLDTWREKYDFMVLDGPPLLPITDARVLHPLADITLLLTRSGVTQRDQFLRSYRLLTNASKHFVGVIVNGIRPQDDYGYYGYRKYSNQYGEDVNATSK